MNDKMLSCKHKNISGTYWEIYSCETPYCTATETYCLDCRAFIVKCGCGYNNGISGWPLKRYRQMEFKKEIKYRLQMQKTGGGK